MHPTTPFTARHCPRGLRVSGSVAILAAVLLAGCEARDAAQTETPAPAEAPEKADRSAEQAPLPQAAPSPMVHDTLAALGTAGGMVAYPFVPPPEVNTEKYPDADPNPVKVAAEHPLSTFSIDVDTASYGVMRRYLTGGTLPPRDAIRVEEIVNYFDYGYAPPESAKTPFATHVQLYPTPWNKDTLLLHIGIKGYDVPQAERPPANLVFLLDVSGSMQDADKLPLVKRSIRLLVDQLDDRDSVAIVVYAGAAGTVLAPTSGKEKAKIRAALDRLEAGGSTAGGEGIRQAYELAEANLAEGRINRVMLATDGDFNVGIADPERLEDFVAEKRKTGVTLTVLGFGGGNYNDVMMQTLAQAGNGNAAYIDTLSEARKVLVDELSSTLFTIATDVKVQVEFNPAVVAEYRLIGYETRALERTDFNNDAVDAGDIGAGHSVTALYEVVPVGSPARLSDPLRYAPQASAAAGGKGELAFLRIRYKEPGAKKSAMIERTVRPEERLARFEEASEDTRFAAAAAAFSQLLRGDSHMGAMTLAEVSAIAQAARGADPFGYRAEFVRLVQLAEASEAFPPLDKAGPVLPN